MAGFSTNSCVFSMDSHRLAPDQHFSGSFEGVKTIAISLFSWEFAFLTPRCQTPVFGKVHLRLEIPLFSHFRGRPTDHSDTFLPGFSAFRCGRTHPKHLPFKHRRHRVPGVSRREHGACLPCKYRPSAHESGPSAPLASGRISTAQATIQDK